MKKGKLLLKIKVTFSREMQKWEEEARAHLTEYLDFKIVGKTFSVVFSEIFRSTL